MVLIKVEKAKIDQKQTPLLVIGVFEGEQDFPHSKEIDSSIIVYTLGKGPMKKIMLLGLGNREKFTDESARICAGKAAQKARDLGIKEFSILSFSNLDEGLVEAMTEGIALALYSFDKY